MRYPVVIEPGTDVTAYGVIVPDLPGCFSAGDTLDEAMSNAEEAIEVVIDAMNGDRNAVVRESADLLYNLTVLWASAGVRLLNN